jgi:hypothetical protein
MLHGTELDDAYNMSINDVSPKPVNIPTQITNTKQLENQNNTQRHSQPAVTNQFNVNHPQRDTPPSFQHIINPVPQTRVVTPMIPQSNVESMRQFQPMMQSFIPQMQHRSQIHELYKDNAYELGIIDNMVTKRREVLKIIILAVTIVLGISFHAFIDFWLKEIIMKNELSFKQELGMRLLYPLLIILFVWFLKAIGK